MQEYATLPRDSAALTNAVSDRSGVSRAVAKIRLKEFGAIEDQ